MRTTDRLTRQMNGCGFEPPPPPPLVAQAWDHPGREPAKDELDDERRIVLELCPGYACGLPEVIEVSRARTHWSKGQLVAFLGGDQPTDELLAAIEILEYETNRVQSWEMKESQRQAKGGG